MLVEAFQKLFKLGFLLWRKDRAELVAPFLTDLLELRVRLIVEGLRLAMLLQQNSIHLLALSARQVQ